MRFLGFAVISGIGWLLDFGVFWGIVRAGLDPFQANLISAGLAVTFVYFASVRRLFIYEGRFLLLKFLFYVVYQVAAIAAASLLIATIAPRLGAMLAKVAVTPLTLLTNFAFMTVLTRAQRGQPPQTPPSPDKPERILVFVPMCPSSDNLRPVAA